MEPPLRLAAPATVRVLRPLTASPKVAAPVLVTASEKPPPTTPPEKGSAVPVRVVLAPRVTVPPYCWVVVVPTLPPLRLAAPLTVRVLRPLTAPPKVAVPLLFTAREKPPLTAPTNVSAVPVR